jgi:hypothetical protein
MLQLFNNHVGFDRNALGFPSVDSCNAIVYQTRQGLCGLHNYGGDSPQQYESRAAAFTAFIQQCNMLHMDQSRSLYSVINSTKRYDCTKQVTRQLWVAEMRAFSTSLNFTGTVHLIALKAHLDGGPVYIQYDLNNNGDGCDVSYKKYSKIEGELVRSETVQQVPPTLHELKKDMPSYHQGIWRYNLAAPDMLVTTARVRGHGHLHPATGEGCDNSFRFSFTCP